MALSVALRRTPFPHTPPSSSTFFYASNYPPFSRKCVWIGLDIFSLSITEYHISTPLRSNSALPSYASRKLVASPPIRPYISSAWHPPLLSVHHPVHHHHYTWPPPNPYRIQRKHPPCCPLNVILLHAFRIHLGIVHCPFERDIVLHSPIQCVCGVIT